MATDEQITLDAIRHWHQLAIDQDGWVEWYASLGNPYGDTSTYRVRAQSYRGAAATLMLQLMTGQEHCTCGHTLQPISRCPKLPKHGQG